MPEASRQAAAWLQLFARTMKTWRLYDESNPTVEQFRVQLAASLTEWLEAHGALTLRFSADTIRHGGHVLHESRSRDDQLSLVFFRDGIQAVTFTPGLERAELDVFLASVVRMSTRTTAENEDLVTLLWDAALVHVDLQYVSAESDLDLEGGGGSTTESDAASGPPIAWPAGAVSAPRPAANDPALALTGAAASRSEDWSVSDPTAPLDDEFERVAAVAAGEVRRFQAQRTAERDRTRGHGMLLLFESARRAGLEAADAAVLAPALVRVFEEALTRGDWDEAARALVSVRACRDAAQEREHWASLAHPESLLTQSAIRALDAQPQAELARFLELATAIGEPGLDWLVHVMAESEQQRVRRPLARTISGLAATDPDRLGRWLADPRWYVVRNLVIALHAIGGDAVVSWLASVAGHPERRVRLEVIGALAAVPAVAARPILLRLARTDDARELSGTLRLLATGPDAEVADLLLERVLADDFPQRSPEEHRAVLAALALTGDEGAAALLETRLDPPRRPEAGDEMFLRAVAHALARMSAPAAEAALRRAMGSRWPAVRDAASLALAARRPR